jgi:hypothetical protein
MGSSPSEFWRINRSSFVYLKNRRNADKPDAHIAAILLAGKEALSPAPGLLTNQAT